MDPVAGHHTPELQTGQGGALIKQINPQAVGQVNDQRHQGEQQ